MVLRGIAIVMVSVLACRRGPREPLEKLGPESVAFCDLYSYERPLPR